MARLPDAAEQVLRMHAPFIHAVVDALRDRSRLPALFEMLREAEARGWALMVSCVRQIIDGDTAEVGAGDLQRIKANALHTRLVDPQQRIGRGNGRGCRKPLG